MNEELYNKLLQISQSLIKKHSFSFLDKFDLVHECWDFKEQNFNLIINKIYIFFYSELKKSSSYRLLNIENEEIPVEFLNSVINKKQRDAYKQCVKCTEVLPLEMFKYNKDDDYYLKYCNKCHYQINKEIILQGCKKYQQSSEKYKHNKLVYYINRTEEQKQKDKESKNKYYERNRLKIREKYKNGEYKDNTAHERYLRFKNKHILV